MVRKAIVAAIALAIAAPAQADWQWTEWGMTEAELREAAPAPLLPLSAPEFDRDGATSRLATAHNASGVRFGAVFRFSADGRLNGVHLRAMEVSDCRRILTDLTSAYGEPVRDRRDPFGRMVYWRDTANGNDVEYRVNERGIVPLNCFIDYRELRTANNLGY